MSGSRGACSRRPAGSCSSSATRYLHTGLTLEVRRQFEAFLTSKGYRVAPVTVDNYDYLFAAALDRAVAKGDSALQAQDPHRVSALHGARRGLLRAAGGSALRPRDPPDALIHASALNARAFGTLATMLEARGYKFITLEEALADPAYRSADTYVGPGGITLDSPLGADRRTDEAVLRRRAAGARLGDDGESGARRGEEVARALLVVQRLDRIEAGGAGGGIEAEDEADADRDDEGQDDRAWWSRSSTSRRGSRSAATAPTPTRTPTTPPVERDDRRLDQELADDVALPGADGAADADLARPLHARSPA